MRADILEFLSLQHARLSLIHALTLEHYFYLVDQWKIKEVGDKDQFCFEKWPDLTLKDAIYNAPVVEITIQR
jgi:hypothetical protein